MGLPIRILMVEDNPDDAALIVRQLGRSGYDPVVARVDTPSAMNAALEGQSWDAVLADWSMPTFDALFALEMLKSKGLDVPFIIVSGSIGEDAAVTAMKSGVHDYVMKRDLSRLVPVIERELREAEERRARRHAEQALAASEERLQLVMRATNDAVRDWDLSTNRVIWNEGIQNLFGYCAGDHEPDVESWYSRLHEDERESVIRSCYAAINGTATVWSEEYRFRRADGTYVYALDRSYILRNNKGQALRLIGALTDLTARKLAEESLRQSEGRLRAILDSSLDAIIGMDQNGVITSWNPRAEVVFGWTEEEAIGQVFADIVIPERDREIHHRGLRHCLVPDQAPMLNRRLEIVALRKGGAEFPAELSISMVTEGPSVRFYGFLADIGDRKQAEFILGQMTEQLRQSQKMEAVGQLAGGVAHDFNNVLTVITGYTELLKRRQPPDSPELEDLEQIRLAAERASWLTRQLLAFSRRQILTPQVLDLNALIGHVEKLLHRLIGEDVVLKTVLTPALARIKADPGQIEQIIMNLTVNACDAMPMGGCLTIETGMAYIDAWNRNDSMEMPPGRYVQLTVSDTGCGIDADTQKRVFEPFFTTKEPGKGTGLGLSTVYGIVKQTNGFIRLYSEPGLGTQFKIYFPGFDETVPAVTPGVQPIQQQIGVETILLVEDASSLRALTQKLLELSGYTVVSAANLDEALKTAEEKKWEIDLLLTDVIMPGGSGPEVAKHLRTKCPDLKILFMSGYTGTALAHQWILESGSPLLQKPYTPGGLWQKVREVLDQPLRKKP